MSAVGLQCSRTGSNSRQVGNEGQLAVPELLHLTLLKFTVSNFYIEGWCQNIVGSAFEGLG